MKKVFGNLRAHLRKTIVLTVLAIVVAIGYALSRPSQPTYVTALSVRGDLTQTVEAVGTVVSENDLALQFPTTDVVTAVLVKEGDRVTAGQKLASLRSGSLAAGVASAAANVQSAQAALRALEEGSRPEDIAIAQAEVRSKLASLEAVKRSAVTADQNLDKAEQQLDSIRNEAKVSLAGYVSTANSAISQQLSVAKTALPTIDGVFASNEVQDAVIRGRSTRYEIMNMQLDGAVTTLAVLQTSITTASEYQAALANLDTARQAVNDAVNIANQAYDILSGFSTNEYLTQSKLEAHKSTIASQKSAVQTALSTLDSATKTFRDSEASFSTKIITQQGTITSLQGTLDKAKSDILTTRASLDAERAQLELKMAPARDTDVDAARARVRQAQADLARALSQLHDTQLFAPIDGVVTKVNVKTGELKSATEPAVTMLGASPAQIEMFLSEVDIPKVQLLQRGSIELDAFRGTHVQLRVSEIDPAATDKDGVSKYRVVLDFRYPHPELKIGMTGDAAIVTGERSNVVSVPERAIIDGPSGTKVVRVLSDKEVENRIVTTGMDSQSGNVEVEGVREGETVVVLEKK